MKDNLLFQYIRNAIKQKQNFKPQQSTTFAERYCKQQLIKKKLNKHNPHEKMTHLMKKFRDLDTYVDLPELIESVRKWKFRELQETHQPKPSFIIRKKKYDSNINHKIKKQLGQKIKEKYLNDNTHVDEVLQFLQKDTRIRSDGLKNSSNSNLNNLFESVCLEGDDQTWKGNFDFLEILHQASQSGENYQQQKLTGVHNDDRIKDSQLNSKPRKEFTKLLHKVTTYLQIILETQHKQKWNNKKYSNKQQNHLNNGEKQKNHQPILPPTNPKLINLAQLKNYKINRQDMKADKQNDPQMSQTMRVTNELKKSNFIRHKRQLPNVVENQGNEKNYSTHQGFLKSGVSTKLNQSSFNRSNLFKSLYCESNNSENVPKQRNDSFYRTTSSFKIRTEAIMSQFPPENKHKKYNSLLKPSIKDIESKRSKQAVKENFTFRNRNIKQKIVNKLSSFIREIDEQEHNNQRQNNYYNTAINKLQNTLAMCFGQFKQEAIAGDADIETLTKYANYYNHNGSIPILSSCNYGQLLKLNEGGLFALSTNSTKTDFELDPPLEL